MRLQDLSHTVHDGMITYPGLPAPQVGEHLTFEESRRHYAEGTEFSIGRVTMVANTGTYLDTPAHRFPDGHDLADLPLERCTLLDAVVVDARERTSILPDVLDDVGTATLAGAAVLFRTGWDRHFGTPRYGAEDHPSLDAGTADRLVEAGVALVGIDSVNVDPTTTGERPVHTRLLQAGVLVVEHLTRLDRVPARGARFTATPVAVAGLATFPVRAFASWDEPARP